ncbi:hypothetical protein [Scopulibacillus cellulosilyticus]|uniref:Uncharacterized protein n=1 Tax=Scopulibacillus cellulosilyticus TaxID=2665665 RepID=A0ABW2PXX5_9BACL
MDYISREQFDKIVNNKSLIALDELVNAIESLGYSVAIEKKPQLTEKQKKYMTKAIFNNKEILEQLKEASSNQDYIKDDKEAIKIIREARNDG